MDNKKFLNYCLNNLDLNEPDQFEEYFASVPLCAFNAVFSINTKYEAVLNALNRFCEHFELPLTHSTKGQIPPNKKQRTVTHVYNLVKDISPEVLAAEVFKNRQRTSTTNGILKAEASLRFIKILKDFGVETYQDIPKLVNNETFEDCIKRIPGQRSGVSLKYFFMLTGAKDQIKPDRMILGFIKDATGMTLKPHEALELVQLTVERLREKGYKDLNARHLDNLIWNFQRS